MGQSMAVSTLLRRVGRLLTNPSEGDQLVFIGKGDRKPPKQVDMGNSGQSVRNVYGITEVGSWTAGALDASVPPTDGFIGPGWGAKIAVMPEEAGESGPQGFEPHTSDEVGEVWLRTPALMQSYYERPDLYAAVVEEAWFRTGDLGFLDSIHSVKRSIALQFLGASCVNDTARFLILRRALHMGVKS